MPVNMKSIIADAYYQQTKQKSVDKITVKDLVEACHISRQTFYYHFRDLQEVLEWSAQQALQKALERSKAAPTPEEAMKLLIQATDEQHELIQKLLRSQKRASVEQMMVHVVQAYLVEMFRSTAADLSISCGDLAVAIQLYSIGIAGILLQYSWRPSCAASCPAPACGSPDRRRPYASSPPAEGSWPSKSAQNRRRAA